VSFPPRAQRKASGMRPVCGIVLLCGHEKRTSQAQTSMNPSFYIGCW
jgi:hypothetical protein